MSEDVKEEIVHTYEPNGATSFVLVVAKEGVRTVDGREFAAGAIEWREPPLSLMMIRENDPTGRGGHKSSSAVGVISELWREDDDNGFGTIYGKGYFASDDKGDEARQLIAEGTISGVSADVGGAVVEELEASDEFGLRKIIRRGTIVAVTALPIPAFNDTKVSIVQEPAPVLASATDVWAPESRWFENPKLDKPTPITVTADGKITGHAALWGTCHVGYRDRCVTPPRSKSNYSYYNVGSVLTADGKTVSVGRLTAGTNHAQIDFGPTPARDHYDNTGWAAAYVHAGEDEHGVWFAGTVSPSATPEQIAVLRASSVSGDWRAINGNLEMVGVLAVNTPGFPIPKARAGLVAGAQISLIASGLCGCDNENEEDTLTGDFTVQQGTIELGVDEVIEEEPEEKALDLELRLRLMDLAMWESKCKGKCSCDKCKKKASFGNEDFAIRRLRRPRAYKAITPSVPGRRVGPVGWNTRPAAPKAAPKAAAPAATAVGKVANKKVVVNKRMAERVSKRGVKKWGGVTDQIMKRDHVDRKTANENLKNLLHNEEMKKKRRKNSSALKGLHFDAAIEELGDTLPKPPRKKRKSPSYKVHSVYNKASRNGW